MIADAAKQIRKPKPWKHSEPITRAQLVQMRDEFWDTAPHYGGRKGNLHKIREVLPLYLFPVSGIIGS